jgi:hypothetical protein
MANGISVLERLMMRPRGRLSAEMARHILSVDFTPREHARVARLSKKASEGTLTKKEAVELDDFLAADAILTGLQSRARLALRKQNSAA